MNFGRVQANFDFPPQRFWPVTPRGSGYKGIKARRIQCGMIRASLVFTSNTSFSNSQLVHDISLSINSECIIEWVSVSIHTAKLRKLNRCTRMLSHIRNYPFFQLKFTVRLRMISIEKLAFSPLQALMARTMNESSERRERLQRRKSALFDRCYPVGDRPRITNLFTGWFVDFLRSFNVCRRSFTSFHLFFCF